MSGTDEIRDSYNRIAEDYKAKRENPADSTWNRFLESPAMLKVLGPLVPGRRALDLGCGTGILTREILAMGGEVVGIDLSERMVELARSENDNLEYLVARGDSLPFDNASFDVVASSLVMHYVQDLCPIFVEVARVLDKGGHFVFTIHHPINECFTSKIDKAAERLSIAPYFHNEKYHWRMCGEELPSYHHTFENIIGSLSAVGFLLANLIECRPEKGTENEFADYTFCSRFPTFCLFHAFLK